jgi:hypothetical protein
MIYEAHTPVQLDSPRGSTDAMRHQDRLAMQLLFWTFCFLYAYFFQGGGWNQNSHFDAVRSLVERHTLEITPIAMNTGDIAMHEGKVFANKGPGLAIMTAPVYWCLYQLERSLSLAVDSIATSNLNAHIVTFFASGLPGVLLVLVLYLHFRRAGATLGEGLWLAAGFGSGTLLFPYAGVMMSPAFTAFALFTTWHVVSGPTSRWPLFAAGLLTGMAVVTDVLAVAVALLLLCYVLWRYSRREWSGFVAGAALIAALFLAYNRVTFGSIFASNQTLEAHQFQTPGLLLGMLGLPEPMRLYWLTFHPFRGLFHCCPVLLLPLLSWPRAWQFRALTMEQVIPLLVIATYALFNLSFNGWTGGWGVGPRYLIPMLPFLYSFSLEGFRRVRVPATWLMALSATLMFCVTAVRVMVPAPNGGAVPPFDPVADSVTHLTAGEVSLSAQGMLDYVPTANPITSAWASYNLGEVFGLQGLSSVVPAALSLAALACLSLILCRRQR